MNHNPDHQPAKRQSLSPFAEPDITPSPLLTSLRGTATGSEIAVPDERSPVTHGQQRPWPPSPPQIEPAANLRTRRWSYQQTAGVASQNRAQLQRLCRHLRHAGRCPGECVLSRARQDRRIRQFPDIG